MPIFDFWCRECAHRFEALVREGGSAQCPKCSGAKLEKQFSSFAVGATAGKGRFSKSAPSAGGGCGSCGDRRGPGSCSN